MSFDPSVYPRTLRETCLYFVRAPRPRFLMTCLLVAWVARVAWGGWSRWDALVPVVILAWWPIQEWLIHVHILHLKPFTVRGRKVDPEVSRKHRRHHRNPLFLEDVFIPARALVGGVLFHWLVWPLVMPSFALALTTIAVYLSFTLHYEWVHMICHTPWVPRSRFYNRLWRNHRLHHFKNEHYWMGVSMLAGDRLLGTSPRKQRVPKSKTCLTLGVDDDFGLDRVVTAP